MEVEQAVVRDGLQPRVKLNVLATLNGIGRYILQSRHV